MFLYRFISEYTETCSFSKSIIYRKKQLLSDEAELFLKIFKKDYHVS